MKKDIKKLLNAVEDKLMQRMHEKPSKETLDRLAIFVGFQNWEDFRTEMDEGATAALKDAEQEEEEKAHETAKPKRKAKAKTEASESSSETKTSETKGKKRAALKAIIHRKPKKEE